MMNYRINGLGMILAAMILAACGGNGGRSDAPDNRDDSDRLGKGNLTLDDAQFYATDKGLRDVVSGDTAWSLRIVVNGSERVNLNHALIADVSKAVKGMQFSRSDVLRLEVTITDGSDSAHVFATNLEEVASKSSKTAAVWAEQCAGQVSPDVDLSKMPSASNDAEAKIQVRICDFVGFSLNALIEIKPQTQRLEKKTVIYHCALKVSTLGNEVYTNTDTHCPYGYVVEAGETPPAITILKKYAPGEPLYMTNVLMLDNFKLNLGNTGMTQLRTTFKKPPFGSQAGCHTQKIDVKYGSAEGIKSVRLVFTREVVAGNNVFWMPQNIENWPSMAEIKSYYSQAGADERVHLYRICDWIPELEDIEAGSVIRLPAQ